MRIEIDRELAKQLDAIKQKEYSIFFQFKDEKRTPERSAAAAQGDVEGR